MKRKLLPEFVRPEHPCMGSSWAASHGGMLTPTQHRFPETHHTSGIRRIQTRPPHSTEGHSCRRHVLTCTSRATETPAHSAPRAREIRIYWLPCSVPVRTCAKQGDGGLWVTTHHLVHRNCPRVCAYATRSTQRITPATPAILHSPRTEQETQPPAASLFWMLSKKSNILWQNKNQNKQNDLKNTSLKYVTW